MSLFYHGGTEGTETARGAVCIRNILRKSDLDFELKKPMLAVRMSRDTPVASRSLRALRASVVKKNAFIAAMLGICVSAQGCRAQQGSEVDPALTAAADSLIPQLEVLSGLRKLRPITMRKQSREELRKYVAERLRAEMPPEELKGLQSAYAALGLVPANLDLEKLLLDLYAEQVAGYYDPKTDAFHMVEGTPRDLLRPTLAHELVHALQDQHADLDSLISRKRGNDRQSAAQAAIEGHATLVMFAVLAGGGVNFDPAGLPDMREQLGVLMEAQNSQFPVFRSAPRIIRETMLFPYIGGAGFVQELWRAQAGSANRFAAPLGERLPQSTEQVLHPRTRFTETRDEPTEVRFSDAADVVYENTIGELELGILLQEHLGNREVASGWDGDRYRVIRQGNKEILVWQSVWDDARSADAFAQAYRQIGQKRTDRAIRVDRNDVGGRNGVWIVDAPAGSNVAGMAPMAVTLSW